MTHKSYRLNGEATMILGSAERLIRRVAFPGRMSPAQLVTVAKLLHVLQALPEVTETVSASISISCESRGNAGGSASRYWDFSAHDGLLSVSTGGSEYDPGVGHDSYTRMEWSILPGKSSQFNDVWDEFWFSPGFRREPREYSISIEDNDNPLLDG